MTNYPKYLILILAVLLVAVMFAGCTSNPAPAQSTTTVPVQTTTTTAPAQVMTTGASFPVVFVGEFQDGILPVLEKIRDDLSRSDWASLQIDSAKLSSQARSSYDKISASDASPEWQAAKTTTLKLLLDFEKSGDLYAKGASAYQAGDYSNAVLYLEQGNTYMQNAVDGMTNTIALIPK